jgi:hypothetical protein
MSFLHIALPVLSRCKKDLDKAVADSKKNASLASGLKKQGGKEPKEKGRKEQREKKRTEK